MSSARSSYNDLKTFTLQALETESTLTARRPVSAQALSKLEKTMTLTPGISTSHRILIGLMLGALSSCCQAGKVEPAPEPAPKLLEKTPSKANSEEERSVKPGINDNFKDPKLQPATWVERWEVESREVYANRNSILEALNIKPGMAVADIGAGTGLFVPALAASVEASGKVFAVDIAEPFLAHIRARAAKEKLSQVFTVLGQEKSCSLPKASVDRILICDTYHHFEFPRGMLASILGSLKVGGEVLIIDFERIEGVSSDWVMGHVRAGKDVVRAECEAAGFKVEPLKLEGLKENYALRLTRS